jgi:hypothetical protein
MDIKFRLTLVVLYLILLSSPAYGTVIYNYVGENYTDVDGVYFTTNNKVTGFFSVEDALPAGLSDSDITGLAGFDTEFSYGTGVNAPFTIFNTNYVVTFNVSTDNFGNIAAWDLVFNYSGGGNGPIWDYSLIINSLTGDEGSLWYYTPCFGLLCDPGGSGYGTAPAGTWSVNTGSAIPEPASPMLMGLGLAGLCLVRRKKAA